MNMEFCADSKAGYDRNEPYDTRYKKYYTDKELDDKVEEYKADAMAKAVAEAKKRLPWLDEGHGHKKDKKDGFSCYKISFSSNKNRITIHSTKQLFKDYIAFKKGNTTEHFHIYETNKGSIAIDFKDVLTIEYNG
jgi:hypothetical protein